MDPLIATWFLLFPSNTDRGEEMSRALRAHTTTATFHLDTHDGFLGIVCSLKGDLNWLNGVFIIIYSANIEAMDCIDRF